MVNKRLDPRYKKIIEAVASRNFSGTIVDIEPPARAPKRLVKIRAHEEPRKTAYGLFVEPLKARVAICVLSPNSARKTVVKIEIKRGKSINYE